MSGHSKWSTIKRKKEATDAKRASAFTKVAREIIMAAKSGGDPDHNFQLRLAIMKAKSINMPNENIQRAIKRGTGNDTNASSYEEVFYEGYGPAGVALLVKALTDNRNRTAGEMRYLFSRNQGNLGEAGCVAWMFETKGRIMIEVAEDTPNEEELLELILEAGALDLQNNGENYEIYTNVGDLEKVRGYLEQHQVAVTEVEITRLPQNSLEIGEVEVEHVIKLIDALEDNDDVQTVYANFGVSDS